MIASMSYQFYTTDDYQWLMTHFEEQMTEIGNELTTMTWQSDDRQTIKRTVDALISQATLLMKGLGDTHQLPTPKISVRVTYRTKVHGEITPKLLLKAPLTADLTVNTSEHFVLEELMTHTKQQLITFYGEWLTLFMGKENLALCNRSLLACQQLYQLEKQHVASVATVEQIYQAFLSNAIGDQIAIEKMASVHSPLLQFCIGSTPITAITKTLAILGVGADEALHTLPNHPLGVQALAFANHLEQAYTYQNQQVKQATTQFSQVIAPSHRTRLANDPKHYFGLITLNPKRELLVTDSHASMDNRQVLAILTEPLLQTVYNQMESDGSPSLEMLYPMAHDLLPLVLPQLERPPKKGKTLTLHLLKHSFENHAQTFVNHPKRKDLFVYCRGTNQKKPQGKRSWLLPKRPYQATIVHYDTENECMIKHVLIFQKRRK